MFINSNKGCLVLGGIFRPLNVLFFFYFSVLSVRRLQKVKHSRFNPVSSPNFLPSVLPSIYNILHYSTC